MVSSHVSMNTFVLLFEFKVQSAAVCQEPIIVFFSVNSRHSYGKQTSALHLCTSPQVAENAKFPRYQERHLFCWQVFMCACTEQWEAERQGREHVDVLWDNERKTTKSKKEKAVKAGEGMSQGVEGPEEDWILTACGELSIPHTDVHNHHPRQLLIIIITAVATGRIRREWLIEG